MRKTIKKPPFERNVVPEHTKIRGIAIICENCAKNCLLPLLTKFSHKLLFYRIVISLNIQIDRCCLISPVRNTNLRNNARFPMNETPTWNVGWVYSKNG